MVYKFSDSQKIIITFNDGYVEKILGNTIDEEYSNMIFRRSGDIK